MTAHRPVIKLYETSTRVGRGLRKRTEPRWYFTVVGGNGEVIFPSELYVSESNARRAINAMRRIIKQNPAVVVMPSVAERLR